jgi:hypothetical protein
MPVIIQNRTDRRVLLRFNSGLTRHLTPGEVLRGVEHVEVKGNAWLGHLEKKHVIALDPPLGTGPDVSTPRRSRRMRAEDAVEHIGRTPLEELDGFLSPDEDRVTVLRAMEAKRGE